MARVLLVGESWFVHLVHQKGFDSFFTSTYEEGAGAFIAALESTGHEVVYVRSHEVTSRFPGTADELDTFDVVVVSDVGANTFQLLPETFERSQPATDRTQLLHDYVTRGGGLLMIGGYLTFSGIDAKARWGRTPLAPALPVKVLDRDDRIELPSGAAPVIVAEHQVVARLDAQWPPLLGLNETVPRDGSTVVAECTGHPLLVLCEYSLGRSAAFTSDVAPHWAPPHFLEWGGYATLFDQLIRWLAVGTGPRHDDRPQ